MGFRLNDFYSSSFVADFESVLSRITAVNLHAVIVYFGLVMDITFIFATVW